MADIFFHVDMDAFYASVEQADNPEYRDKPVIISGSTELRSVVSACSYEARKFGIHSAMPAVTAKKMCPDGIFLPVRMERYKEVSETVMKIFESYTPEVIQISIDEAFLNMTGMEKYMGKSEEIAMRLKQEIRDATGLTLSVGIADNKYLAKLASDYRKPDGLYRVKKGKEEQFLDSLKLKDIWGIGKKTVEKLESMNIKTVKRLREYPETLLSSMLGPGCAGFIYKAVRGIDPGIFSSSPRSRSISNERTFKEDVTSDETLKKNLLELSHQLMFRLMNSEYCSKTVSIKIRYEDFTTVSAQTRKETEITSGEEIYSILKQLLETKREYNRGIRLIGAALLSLEKRNSAGQLDLFENSYKKKNRVERAILEMKKKNPGFSVVKASLIKKDHKNSRQ